MTAIVGLVHDGRVYIGGDSAGTGGYIQTIRADHKVWASAGYVFGFTTSFRMGQLLRHAFTPPKPTVHLDRFMCTVFIDAVRTCLKDGGWASKSSEREEGGTFLVGVAGRLFRVDQDYQVAESIDRFDAVGSGAELALGALHATAHLEIKPKLRLRLALSAAARYSASVAEPFVLRSTK